MNTTLDIPRGIEWTNILRAWHKVIYSGIEQYTSHSNLDFLETTSPTEYGIEVNPILLM